MSLSSPSEQALPGRSRGRNSSLFVGNLLDDELCDITSDDRSSQEEVRGDVTCKNRKYSAFSLFSISILTNPFDAIAST